MAQIAAVDTTLFPLVGAGLAPEPYNTLIVNHQIPLVGMPANYHEAQAGGGGGSDDGQYAYPTSTG
jgi:hypothetical protein